MEDALVQDKEAALPRHLRDLSFTELFELKDKVGSKVYSQLLIGEKPSMKQFHRENKNRPREMSSKIMSVTNKKSESKRTKDERKHIDPRFYGKYGDFNQLDFAKNYKFIENMKKKEQKLLQKELKNKELDDSERLGIKLVLQRMQNQQKEKVRQKKQENIDAVSRNYMITELEGGRKPQYCKKSDRKLFDLISHFEELKQKGGLTKHIKRRRKKLNAKDKRKLKFLDSRKESGRNSLSNTSKN